MTPTLLLFAMLLYRGSLPEGFVLPLLGLACLGYLEVALREWSLARRPQITPEEAQSLLDLAGSELDPRFRIDLERAAEAESQAGAR